MAKVSQLSFQKSTFKWQDIIIHNKWRRSVWVVDSGQLCFQWTGTSWLCGLHEMKVLWNECCHFTDYYSSDMFSGQNCRIEFPIPTGGGHLQSPVHRNASLFQSPSTDPRLCAESSVVRHSCWLSFPQELTAGRAFHLSAPAVWNSLPVFKSRLKTHLFHGS